MISAQDFAVIRGAAPGGPLPRLVAGLAMALALSGCAGGLVEGVEGAQPYSGPDSVIATAEDAGRDEVSLVDGEAAIAYDPDGCQVWILDDGVEGYSSPRFDPATGLPVCDDKFPPGSVIGVYETRDAGISDQVSGPAKGKTGG
jgi:hypothetical protein